MFISDVYSRIISDDMWQLRLPDGARVRRMGINVFHKQNHRQTSASAIMTTP
jgi:hypothetical protein